MSLLEEGVSGIPCDVQWSPVYEGTHTHTHTHTRTHTHTHTKPSPFNARLQQRSRT
jgi:hypothetical protein